MLTDHTRTDPSPAPQATVLFASKRLLAVRHDGVTVKTEFPCIHENLTTYLIFWSLQNLKGLFYRMPLDQIEIGCYIDPEYASDESVQKIYGNVFRQIAQIIGDTNRVITDLLPLKNCAGGFENVLFYIEEGDARLRELFEHVESLKPGGIFLKEYQSNWNPSQRCWESQGSAFDLHGLVNLIRERQIRKIVSANYHVYEKSIAAAIYLPAVMETLGVEFIGIDYEATEYFNISGPTLRKLFHNDNFRRFTSLPSLNQYWDQRNSNRSIHYTTIIRHYPDAVAPIALQDDYSVVVLSHSRHAMVRTNLKIILFVLDQLSADSLMTDLQMWYLSARRIILERLKLGEREIIEFCRVLIEVWYAASQFLKYEVVASLETSRKVRIFGDDGWAVLFPEYYQQRYLNPQEIEALNQRKDILHLLLNNNVSYLEASGSIFDCICKSRPFINFPATLKTSEFKELENIEYDDRTKLNYLIENAAEVYKKPDLQAAIRKLNQIYKSSEKSVVDALLSQDRGYHAGPFEAAIDEHAKLMDEAVDDYVTRNEAKLIAALKAFYDPSLKYEINSSRYSERKYLRALTATD
jgi:hypothetical protein